MSEVFNSPFELGMRMVYLLMCMYPRKADLQKLVYLDYATIYSADFQGPPSLHTPVPLRGGEYISRREVIEKGLQLMAIRGLINVELDSNGISYLLGENGPTLVNLVGGDYPRELVNRCEWVARELGDFSSVELDKLFHIRGMAWGAEFVGSDFDKIFV